MEKLIYATAPATPDNWHWQITPEQIAKIKERDRDTVNKVYFDNLDKFKKMAYRFCRVHKQYSYFRDCVQQVYVDMLYYDYTNAKTLFRSICRSFWRAVGVLRRGVLSFDVPLRDGGGSMYDILPTYEMTDEQDRKDNERRALEIIARQTHLTSSERDYMTACAFGCLSYKGIFDYEYNSLHSV